jgi:predicted nucleotidyltransferase
MAVDVEAVKQLAAQYADDVRTALPVQKAVLYGSYAKGTATELSDIDICFFLDTFNEKSRADIIIQLLGIGGKYRGVFFEPNAFPVSSLSNDNPFVKEIVQTGIEV